MKKILLRESRKRPIKSESFYAIVDDKDYDYLMQWKWQMLKAKHTNYATRVIEKSDGTKATIYMHRQILGLPSEDIQCDHKDHDGLNNQKDNLRPCNNQQNIRNRRPRNGKSSNYLGVTLAIDKRRGYKYWVVRLTAMKKSIFYGTFPYTAEGEIEAARKYDEMAKIHFGEFANLNFK